MAISMEHVEQAEAGTEAVWAVLADLRSWPEWTPTVLDVVPEGSSALELGGRFRLRQPRMPALTWEVTALDPGRGFTWVARSPGLATSASHQLEPTEAGGCRIVLRIEQTGPLASILGRLGAGQTRRYLAQEAAGLAERAASR